MLSEKWRRILKRELILFLVCMTIGLSFAIMGRIIGGKTNSGQIFYLTIIFAFSLLYFFIQSVRAIGWSILNLTKH